MSTPDAATLDLATNGPQALTRPSLRPLAARPPKSRSLTVPSSLPYRASRPPPCPVCSNRGCQLKTHKALSLHASGRGSLPSSDENADYLSNSQVERLQQSVYTKSYAYFYAQVYVDADIASARVDPFYDLPLPNGVNKQEMHMLFHKYFTIEANQSINIPLPPELSSDIVLSPFFLPAMTDSALCLAILTASAASIPQRSSRLAEHVAVLTLFDQAMYQLRERLTSGSGGVSDATVAAATFLWAINALLNDPESMLQHGKGVHALVSRRGGLSNLGLNGAVARLVVMVDNMNAVIFAEKALYPEKVDEVPLEDEPMPLCGAYFRNKGNHQNSNPELSKLCLENVGVANLLEAMIRRRSTAPQYFHALAKLSNISVDLISIYIKLKGTGSKDECICLALQLTNTLLYYKARELQMMVTSQASRLIKALQQQEIPTYWLGDMELLVWILFVLAMLPHDFDGKEWAIDLLCQALCSRFGSEEWPHNWQEIIHQVVLQFSWSDSRLTTGFETILRSLSLRIFGDEENG